MNQLTINDAGGPGEELTCKATQYFCEAAKRKGIDLLGYDPKASLEQQIIWARGRGLEIGTMYLRFSSNIQHSSEDQLRENISAATRLGIFIPPSIYLRR